MIPVGVHSGVPFDVYLADPAVSRSDLSGVLTAPAKAKWAKDHPDDHTKATATGDATHCALLTPDLFAERFHVPPKVDLRTNKGKAEWAAWKDDNPDAVEIRREDYDLAMECRRSVEANEIAAELLRGPGRNELTVVWEDRGTRCKARIDRLTKWNGWSMALDIKTCRDASPFGFEKAMAQYDYHRQAAWYLRGLRALAPMDRRFVFLAVEKEPPFLCAWYECGEGALSQGDDENRMALATWRRCTESGVWPGYSQSVEPIDLPKWRQRQIIEEVEF